MSQQTIDDFRSTPISLPKIDVPETWGSLRRFMRFARVDETDALYWLVTVHRPAHRIAHPVPMDDCPGCAFEAAAKVESTR